MSATPGWTLPDGAVESGPEAVVRTGPSGLLLGHGRSGPIAIRLFRPVPTRLLLAVPEYVTWLLAFRCISLGAHLSIVANERRRWQGLVDAVQGCGGTSEFLAPVMLTEDAAASGAIHALRSCDMALVSPCDARTIENLRRAYVLTPRQLRLCADLGANEVVLAMPRRLVRLSIPPTPTEYDLLFGHRRRH